MADITPEQYQELPEFIKGDYEQLGDIYRPKSEGKAAALKTSLNSLNEKFNGAKIELDQFKSNQALEIEKAKKEALEAARQSGNVSELEKRYQEQLADLEGRHKSELEQLQASYDSLAGNSKASARDAMLADIRAELKVFDDSASTFNRLVGTQIDIDPVSGKATFLDESGSATSLDKAGFIKSLMDDPAYSRMRQGQPSGSGGMANGNNSAGGAPKSFNDMTLTERAKFANEHPEEYKSKAG